MDENLAGERFATFRDAFAEFLQSCPDRRIVRMGQKVSLIDQFEINHEDDDDHSRKEVNFEQIDFAINALMSDPSKRNNALIGALRHCIWTDLPDCPQISLASIGASHSNGLKLDLWLLPSNFQLKQHHTNFEAVSHVASCGPNLRIGYSKLFLKPCDAGFTRRTLPTEPLTVHSDPDAPTLIVRVSSKGDELTFADLEFGREYLQKHKSYELEESENVYDEVANNYRKATAGVGYFMPAYLSELLVEDFELSNEMKLLDLACGDGLMGETLKSKGFQGQITGIDLSAEMLRDAHKTGAYFNLIKANLLEKIDLEDNSMDCVTCVGACGAFLKPSCLDDWLRVVRVGGLICFHVGSVYIDAWHNRAEELIQDGKWKAEFRPEEKVPVLTSILEDDDSMDCFMARVYVFRKC